MPALGISGAAQWKAIGGGAFGFSPSRVLGTRGYCNEWRPRSYPEPMEDAWLRRARWRIRGAWQWPSFAVFTAGEAVMLHELPLTGSETGFVPALLLAAFLNLVAVAVLAPLAGARLRRYRPDLPKIVAADYAGTGLIVLIFGGLLAGGLAHRPAAREEARDFAAQSAAVRMYVAHHAAPVFRANIGRADTWRIEPDRFRTCVPGPDPRRSLCLLVNTDQSPPGITVDPSRAPNSTFIGPDVAGHMR